MIILVIVAKHFVTLSLTLTFPNHFDALGVRGVTQQGRHASFKTGAEWLPKARAVSLSVDSPGILRRALLHAAELAPRREAIGSGAVLLFVVLLFE